MPEFIDPRFRENKPKKLVFSHIEHERFGLVFAKTVSIISGTDATFQLAAQGTTYFQTKFMKFQQYRRFIFPDQKNKDGPTPFNQILIFQDSYVCPLCIVAFDTGQAYINSVGSRFHVGLTANLFFQTLIAQKSELVF